MQGKQGEVLILVQEESRGGVLMGKELLKRVAAN